MKNRRPSLAAFAASVTGVRHVFWANRPRYRPFVVGTVINALHFVTFGNCTIPITCRHWSLIAFTRMFIHNHFTIVFKRPAAQTRERGRRNEKPRIPSTARIIANNLTVISLYRPIRKQLKSYQDRKNVGTYAIDGEFFLLYPVLPRENKEDPGPANPTFRLFPLFISSSPGV